MTVHLEASLHTHHCCMRHGCRYEDEQCPVFFGKLPQIGPCVECRRKGSGPFKEIDPFSGRGEDPHERKTPVPAPAAKLTTEQMLDLLVDLLDVKEVQERIAEVVIDVLRERLLHVTEERRRGSYVVLNPDVEDDFNT